MENTCTIEVQREDISDRNKKQTKIKTINLTNIRKSRTAAQDEKRKEKGKNPKKRSNFQQFAKQEDMLPTTKLLKLKSG